MHLPCPPVAPPTKVTLKKKAFKITKGSFLMKTNTNKTTLIQANINS